MGVGENFDRDTPYDQVTADISRFFGAYSAVKSDCFCNSIERKCLTDDDLTILKVRAVKGNC